MLERTHLLRDDLDWLPRWLKAVRWTVAGSMWTGLAGIVVGLVALTHGHVFLFSQGVTALALGGIYVGDRTARAVLRRRLSKLAQGDVDIGRLKNEPDGELVHVKGRVRSIQKVPGKLGGQGVYRRLQLQVGMAQVVHEAAVDFHLDDGTGETILVQVAGARLITREPEMKPLSGDVLALLSTLTLPERARRAAAEWEFRFRTGKSMGAINAAEILLQDGQMVEIVGYKNRAVDPTLVERLERETPMRATVRSGKELPLLISPL